MKKYLSAILLLATCGILHGQNSITGTIKDNSTDSVLAGVTVYIHDLKTGATTNEKGTYTIKNLPAGKFLIEIKYIGFNSIIKTIEITGNTTINFNMEPSVTEINDVVITGVSKATERRQSSVPSLIVSKQALLEQSSTNIVDMLAKQPGISQITTGAAISKPVIRGWDTTVW